MVEKMARLANLDKKLISYELIAGGCANFNFNIQWENDKQPFILRIYLRDKDGAYREQKLAVLLKPTIPVPLTYYIGEVDGYRFPITEFMLGITLRDFLLGNLPHDISGVMYEVGTIFSNIAMHEFSSAGFFNKNLSVTPHTSSYNCLTFTKDCLEHETVLPMFTPDVISKVSQALDQYGHLFPGGSEKHLVHGDFDPANIFVDQIDGTWKVSGVFDWEYSFAGSILWDDASIHP